MAKKLKDKDLKLVQGGGNRPMRRYHITYTDANGQPQEEYGKSSTNLNLVQQQLDQRVAELNSTPGVADVVGTIENL